MAGSIAWVVQADRRRILLDNLQRIVPDATERDRRRLARRTLRNMTTSALDLFRLPSIGAEGVRTLVTCRGCEHLDAAAAMGKGVIVVTGHIGPYELGGAWAAAAGYPIHAMVEDLAPDVAAALASYRRATGMEIISMNQGLRSVFKLLAAGRIVVLVADRAVGNTRGVVEVPFLGGVRPVPTGPATFAMATGAPIVVGFITLNPGRNPRYLLEFTAPFFARGRGDDERLRLTRQITDRLAAVVEKHPDEWYVFQPQWLTPDRD